MTYWKTVPRSGSYVSKAEASLKLNPLKNLLEELLEEKTGIKPINIPPIDTNDNPSLRESIKDALYWTDKSRQPY